MTKRKKYARESKQSIEEALEVIRRADVGHAYDQNSVLFVEAANTLMMSCQNDNRITFDDLLKCLDFGGVIAEMGARGLYLRTGRDNLGWNIGEAWTVDRADWEQYLRKQGWYLGR